MNRIFFFSLWFFMWVGGFSLSGQSSNPVIRDTLEAKRFQVIGDSLLENGQTREAIQVFQQLRAYHEANENWEAVAFRYLDLAVCQNALRDFVEMEKLLVEGLKISEANLDSKNQVFGYFYQLLGAAYGYLKDFDKGLQNSLKSLRFYQERKEAAPNQMALLNHNIGMAHYGKGDYDRAKEYLDASIRLKVSMEKKDDYSISNTLQGISRVYFRKREYSLALDYAIQSLNKLSESKRKGLIIRYIEVYNAIATNLNELARYDSALNYLGLAMHLHQKSSKKLERTLHNIAYTYRLQKKYDQANTYLVQAIEANLNKKNPDYLLLAKDYRHLGVIATDQGKLPEALDHFQKGLSALSPGFKGAEIATNPPVDSVLDLLTLIRLLRDKGNAQWLLFQAQKDRSVLEASQRTHSAALKAIDRLRLEFVEGSSQFLTSEYIPLFERAIGVSLALYDLTGDIQYADQALGFAEESKAVLLLGALRDAEAKKSAGIPDSLYEKEQNLKRDLAFYQKKIFEEKQKGENAKQQRIDLWSQYVFDLNREQERLVAKLEADFPAYHKQKYQTGVVSIRTLQGQLSGKNKTLVAYFMGDSALHAFAINGKEVRTHSMDWDPSLLRELEAFVQQSKNRNAAFEGGMESLKDFASAGHLWYERLLKPLEVRREDALVIVPDGLLAYLPFEAMVTEAVAQPESFHDLNFVLRDHPVHYAFSATLWADPAINLKTSRISFAGFAPAYESGNISYPQQTQNSTGVSRAGNSRDEFVPLPNNRKEVAAIQELVSGKVFLGTEAREVAFHSLENGARILHLAMHGFINDKNPMFSALVFELEKNPELDSVAHDGFLYAYEIQDMNLNAELAVLSACHTGGGQLLRGEGVASLARAFRYAGCPNLVMSLWQADDEATFEMVKSFYTHLKAGKGKATALRQAKLDFLETHDNVHPHFWSGFVLLGNDEPVNMGGSMMPIVTGGIALLLLLAGWGLWKFKIKKEHS